MLVEMYLSRLSWTYQRFTDFRATLLLFLFDFLLLFSSLLLLLLFNPSFLYTCSMKQGFITLELSSTLAPLTTSSCTSTSIRRIPASSRGILIVVLDEILDNHFDLWRLLSLAVASEPFLLLSVSKVLPYADKFGEWEEFDFLGRVCWVHFEELNPDEGMSVLHTFESLIDLGLE